MKKILIATTALVATAGMASADIANINVGGFARFGVRHDGSKDGTTARETWLDHRLQLTFDGKATTDSGVAFSARTRVRIEETNPAGGNTDDFSAARFSAEAGGLRIDVANAGGALDNLPGLYGVGVGLAGLFDHNNYLYGNFDYAGFTSSGAIDRQTAYARYATGGFAVAGSYTQGDIDAGNLWDAHAAYSFSNATVAVAYGQDWDKDKNFAITGQYGAGAWSVQALYGQVQKTAGEDKNYYGLGATYDVNGNLGLKAQYAGGTDADGGAYGIGASYSLGGGVSIAGGIASIDKKSHADLGVSFSF